MSIDVGDIATLQVRIHPLDRWWVPGALLIGDAAHTLSPIAGVGINLAVHLPLGFSRC